MTIPLLLTVLLISVAVYQVRFTARRRKYARTWQEVLSRLEHLNIDGLRLIADNYLHPDEQQLRLEPEMMWVLAGGMEGMKQLLKNAELLLELAVIAEQWNQVEGIIIAEMLRRDTVRIRKAVRHIRMAVLWNGTSLNAPFHVQEAVSAYYLMRGRLLGLYRNAHVALVPEFEAAI